MNFLIGIVSTLKRLIQNLRDSVRFGFSQQKFLFVRFNFGAAEEGKTHAEQHAAAQQLGRQLLQTNLKVNFSHKLSYVVTVIVQI